MATTRILPALLLLSPLHATLSAPLRAQGAAPAPALVSSYRSFAVESQLAVENMLQAGRVAGEVGRVWPLGWQRAWLPQAAVALSLLPGDRVLDGVALGPRITLARVLPLGFVTGPRDRGLVLGASAVVDGAWRFAGVNGRGTRLEPAVRGSLGYRFRPERASWLTTVRILVEGRAHVSGPTVYLSGGFEQPRGRAPE